MNYFAGIDIGSTTIKIVIVDAQSTIIGDITCPTGSHFHLNAMTAFEKLLAEQNLERQEVVYAYSTGYGRKLFKDADDTISEISANAAGAWKMGQKSGNVRTMAM